MVVVLPIQYDVVIACVYNVVCVIKMTFLLPVCVFNYPVGVLRNLQQMSCRSY